MTGWAVYKFTVSPGAGSGFKPVTTPFVLRFSDGAWDVFDWAAAGAPKMPVGMIISSLRSGPYDYDAFDATDPRIPVWAQ